MSTAAKRRALVVFLILLALWPAVHRALVVHYRLNPWLLFGFAMYTTPRFPVDLGVAGLRGSGIALPDLRDAVPALGPLVRDAARRREALGELASIDPLGRAALRLAEERGVSIDGVIVRATHPYLDPHSATIRRHERFWGWRVVGDRIVGPEPITPP